MAAALNLRQGRFSLPSIPSYMNLIQVAVCQTTTSKQQHSDNTWRKERLAHIFSNRERHLVMLF